MSPLIVYLPFLQKPFGTYPLSIEDWIVVVLTTLTVFGVLEITKLINRWQFEGVLHGRSA